MRRKRRKRRIAQIFVIVLSLISLVIAAGLIYSETKPMVANAVTIEAGTPSIDVAEFMLEKNHSGSFITDIESLNLNVPGNYEVQIQVNKKVLTSSLEVVDTVAPSGEPVEVIALMHEVLKPSDFVDNIVDATEVKLSFITEPDNTTHGESVVKVALEDAGKNIKIIESKLTILDVRSSVQVEAGGVLDVKPEDFVDNDNISIRILSDLSGLDISQPAAHTIQIEVDGKVMDSNIEVVDTTPPTATPRDKEAWKSEAVSPGDFIKDVWDISAYTVSFAKKPDFEAVGKQEVTVVIEDIYKNRTELKAYLTIKEDKEPPVIHGVKDITVLEGETVSYRKGITVTDNKDKDIGLTIDTSNVKLNKAGTYTVYYSAQDSAGNRASASATVTVNPFVITEEMLYAKVDPILQKITKKGMTKREIAYEIYKWIKGHVGYTGTSDKSNWMNEAYRGIVNGLGDCFTYYAVSEAFLTRAGIDNMRVTRVGGRTQHFWNLINCGEGWYHFDTCPNKDKIETFMLTDAEVEAYTKKRGNNYYTFDKSLYPATPEN